MKLFVLLLVAITLHSCCSVASVHAQMYCICDCCLGVNCTITDGSYHTNFTVVSCKDCTPNNCSILYTTHCASLGVENGTTTSHCIEPSASPTSPYDRLYVKIIAIIIPSLVVIGVFLASLPKLLQYVYKEFCDCNDEEHEEEEAIHDNNDDNDNDANNKEGRRRRSSSSIHA
jgi:hypothetical protein